VLLSGCGKSAEEKYQECMKDAAASDGPHESKNSFGMNMWLEDTKDACREASGYGRSN
jgi:hypothetical protein